jgi:tRNA 5-methylaminomethyl-2-thiouridine biosynthesis bifunctional protein
MPGPPGRYAATGYGGRGILWSVLGAEVIAADIEGEPAPVETDLLAVLDPGRVIT